MKTRFKIGWYDTSGKRRYKTVDTEAEAIKEAAEKLRISDQVSLKRVRELCLSDPCEN